MGLDQYLVKKRKDLKKEYKNFEYEEAYWRKANQIHKWFVDKVQNGVDDCEYYEVSKEQIEELLDTCKEVISKSKLVEGKVYAGKHLDRETNEWVTEYVDGKYIEDTEIAESLLPTTSGFFFGSTDYDEYYIQDLTYTIETFEKLLENFDFENYDLFYTSSW